MRNPNEFWTPYPFPSMSISDENAFQCRESNNWGGYSQGLTALRTLRWMDYYGKQNDLEQLMTAWVNAFGVSGDLPFTQEIHPINGKPSNSSPWYSSSMLFYIASVKRLF